ncbi:hypothetical protein GCK72_004609 [Caenorhabditis remanei]|uniref:ISXO2-like transposase domain-containing protein n=1 Tax=Caenorhabditis remanei TaxID=31234 RepID=A0A6A5HA23_CAERE|nr:hypothetical protein GCK72_004609 [Caenorhabditis remanei]KAF1764660.1 hypothetical protein GCK72_004609 [Caenorhabditis remanei]
MIIVLWVNKYTSKQIVKETKLSPSTVVDFRNYLRNGCSEIVKRYEVIGGRGKVVQVDESAVHTRKYGRGEKQRELTWILRAIEDGSRNCMMQIVPNRTKAVMVPLIRSWIDGQSEVHTDCHKSYGTLSRYFSAHQTVNHNKEFKKVMSDGTIVHTNTIESLWKRVKQPLKEGNGTSESLLPSYLDEIIVREREGDRFASRIWQFIKDFKP